jgi:glycosyltransferase involved in cell wall biosynthesis
MKIIISNFVRQHTHLLGKVLYQNNVLVKFFTSLGKSSLPNQTYQNSRVLNFFIAKSLKKRYFEIPNNHIETIPYFELIRQVLLKTGIKLDLWHDLQFDIFYDKIVSKKLLKLDFDIFIGAEKCSFYSFKIAKQKNKITILDLAAVHYKQNEILRNSFEEYKSVSTDSNAFRKLNSYKEKEIKLVDYYFCLSEYAKQTLVDAGVNSKNIYINNLPIDLDTFRPKLNYDLTSKVLKVLFVGRISRLKGVLLLLKTVEILKNKYNEEFEFTFIGPLDPSIDINLLNESTVNYYPFIHHSELATSYQNSDVFVSPSFTDSWGQTVLESMACGTPVIISDNTGAKDAVMQGGGFIIPVDDSNALIEKLIYFHQDRMRLKIHGQEASKNSKSYNFKNYETSVLNSITDIMKRNNISL